MKIRNKKRSINKQSYSPKVKCSSCGTLHLDMYGNGQGINCASYFSLSEKEGYIYSEYGSNFDTMKFIIKNMNIVKKKHYGVKSVICDRCITKNLKKGYIASDESYDAFALITEMNSFYYEDPDLYYEIVMQGPTKCIELIRLERAKPMEQRLKEREGRPKKNLIKLTNSLFDLFE